MKKSDSLIYKIKQIIERKRYIKTISIILALVCISMMLIWRIRLDVLEVFFYGRQVGIGKYYCIICIGLIIGLLGIFFSMSLTHKKDFRIRFAVAMLWIGLLNNFILVPFSVPDESVHFAQSYEVSNLILGVKRNPEDPRVPIMEHEVSWLLDAMEGIQKNYRFFEMTGDENNNPQYFDGFVRQENLMIQSYVPAGIGLAIGRLIKLPYQAILIMGRMTNLLFLILCAVGAMTLYKPLQYAFAGICLLPATVALSAAFTYDVWNMAGVLLFIALVLRLREKEGKLKLTDIILLFGIFIAFVPVKFIYALVGGCIVLIPRKKWDKKLLTLIGLGVLMAVLAVFLTRGQEMLGYLMSNQMDERGRQLETATSYSLFYVMKHPLETIAVMLKTTITKAPIWIFNEAVGENVGAPYPYVPSAVTLIIIVVFLLIMATSANETNISVSGRIVSLILLVIGIVGIYIVFLFTFSTIPEIGIGVIEGIQGRYFVPFYVLLPLAIRKNNLDARVRAVQMEMWPESAGISAQEWLVEMLIMFNYVALYCKLVGVAMT